MSAGPGLAQRGFAFEMNFAVSVCVTNDLLQSHSGAGQRSA